MRSAVIVDCGNRAKELDGGCEVLQASVAMVASLPPETEDGTPEEPGN